MNETNKESFLERSLLVGENSEIYLHRALTVLRNEGLNPYVTYEIQARDDGILCGINQIIDILEHVLPESDREVWSLSDSNEVSKKEVVLRIKSKYSNFQQYDSATYWEVMAVSFRFSSNKLKLVVQ